MSSRASSGHYFLTGAAPADILQYTIGLILKVNSQMANALQLLTAISYNSGDGTAHVGYWHSDAFSSALGVSADSGAPVDFGQPASRPAVGDWMMAMLRSSGSGGTARFSMRNISTPGSWVGVDFDALTIGQAVAINAIEVTSNSNPLDADCEVWRIYNAVLTEAQLQTDLEKSVSASADVCDFRFFAHNNIVEYTGSGAGLTGQGGAAPTTGDSWTSFPGDSAGTFSARGPVNWAAISHLNGIAKGSISHINGIAV